MIYVIYVIHAIYVILCHTVYVIYNVYIYIYYINVYMVPPKKSIVITFTGICGIFAIMDNYF